MPIYNKLVRDKILERIEKEGTKYSSRILSDAEYTEELLKKLTEEAGEVIKAAHISREELILEIADVLEVLEALQKSQQITTADVEKIKAEKKESRGGFEKKIFLESTE